MLSPSRALSSPVHLDLFADPPASLLDRPSAPYSVEEAVNIVYKIHCELESIEDYRLKLKWWMGMVLQHVHCPVGERRRIIDEIAERLLKQHSIKARKTVLYECAKLYEVLSGSYAHYIEWIDRMKRLLGRPVYWYDVVRDLLGGAHNPDVIGREEADDLDFREAERAIEAIERIVLRAHEGNEEALGVLEAVRQSVVGLLLVNNQAVKTPRSDEYRRFVAGFPCLVCRRPADAHHAVGRKGIAAKASDFGCIPLCRVHHQEIYQAGRKSFEELHDFSVLEAAYNLLHKYVSGTWITMKISESA